MNENVKIAVVGATGAVGREVLSALFDAGIDSERITALASERSDAVELEYGEDTLEVEKTTPESFRGMGLVLLATPASASRTLGPTAQAAGAWVVDASSAFRADGSVPLVLPAFNPELLGAGFKGKMVCVPSAVTSALVSLLAPLHKAFGVVRAQVTAMMGASSAGVTGVGELERQTAGLLSGRELEAHAFPHRIGFNLIPQVGDFLAQSPWTEEEAGWTLEAARLFGVRGDTPVIAGTAVQVPTFYGHGLSVHVQLKAAVPVEQARTVLKASPALKVLDAPAEKVYPMPMLVAADPTVLVGRLRPFPQAPEWLTLFAAIDNAGRGAALNLVEAGVRLLQRPA
ncbi:aspartate-semialdehyde dehydrogenase [Stigmatella sp. ncwal1]|uniref:Aspartate-semialdehyde dehydrogenase n=1 Tax=Stigmatella ashevillensis TaxID=2995309 RepID=A0ABT5DMQ2_9BACT|nr:aspartate-semialdehyde dehydrogenase [Stigmatella ashevillena]MDC0714942.1 aspartate-semialdehyde dehydrogenase [Stigmatella ashevillena]